MRIVNPLGLLQDLLANAFYKYGIFVSRHPRFFIFIPILVTVALSFGIFNITIQDDLRFLYSPQHSPSRLEYSIHRDFTGDTINNTYIAMVIETNSTVKNLLRQEIASEIVELNEFILQNLSVNINGKLYNFGRDICAQFQFCAVTNSIIQIFFDAFFAKNKETASSIEVSLIKPINEYLNSNELSLIKASIFSFSLLKDEMTKNAIYTFPFISLTVLLLVSFTVISCMTGDSITSKPLEALMGVLSSSFAIISAAGLLFAIGLPFIYQVTVMPFLALAIGVDDTFVMLGAWQDTKRSLPPSKRMALTLQEAGSAITLTSLTSMLSFGIGSWSTTPAISIFCRFIACAIIFDWFYQVTFFAAIMALGGKREAAGYHCIFVWKKMPNDLILSSRQSSFVSPTHYFFADYIAPFLCRRATRVFIMVIYVVYLAVAIYGCSLLRPNLTPSKLLVDDSPLTHYLEVAEDKIWSEAVLARVYVNNAPNFVTNPENIDMILNLATELESINHSIGKNSTDLWLRDFLHYQQYFENTEEQFYENLENFLNLSFNSHWKPYLQWKNHPIGNRMIVSRFFFTTAYRIRNWQIRAEILQEWRNTTSRYGEFEVVVYDENNFYSDQMLELESTTLISLTSAAVAMIIVCILFIGDSKIVFWVVFTMISMDVGIAGYLSLWGSDLDPTTVVNILMSIGLCIDFSTHVGYRIYRTDETDPNEQIADALGAIGWPVVQGGVSTFLAIIVMILVPSNVVQTFAKTSILVVLTGLFHGVIFLPVLIRTFQWSSRHCSKAVK